MRKLLQKHLLSLIGGLTLLLVLWGILDSDTRQLLLWQWFTRISVSVLLLIFAIRGVRKAAYNDLFEGITPFEPILGMVYYFFHFLVTGGLVYYWSIIILALEWEFIFLLLAISFIAGIGFTLLAHWIFTMKPTIEYNND